MKKLFLTIAMCAVWVVSAAQTIDTIYNRADNGYYERWYDTCTEYLDGRYVQMSPSLTKLPRDSTTVCVISSYTPHPIMISGGIIMVAMEPPSYYRWQYARTKPEYVVLCQYDGELEEMVLIDSARWDTVTPKIMKLPNGYDTVQYGHSYCYGYEVEFKEPVMVDSTFFMGGTERNNVWIDSGPFAVGGYFKYEPSMYCIMTMIPIYGGCPGDSIWCYSDSFGWHSCVVSNPHAVVMRDFGGVIPTLAYFRLEVLTSDSSRGGVTGGGTYTSVDPHTISATAAEGYRFTHWNDGGSDNPRQVWLMSDTVFTAYFVERGQVWAEVSSNDVDLGTVTGGGAYYEGDTATLLALPQPYNKFLCWDDSVCDNPRQVVVTQDTAFTAVFAPLERYVVEAVANNSDRGRVTGGGEYYEWDTVTLTALPWRTFGFLQWDDGDTANPRQFVVTQDTSFTAVFVSREGIEEAEQEGTGFCLLPNPASDEVRCVTGGEGFAGGTLSVTDAAGRTVLRKELARQTQSYTFRVTDYPAGTYYVTLTTPTGTSTRKLIVE